ncbi:MAG: tetratricopeptide repeat protein, partial [Planctomycetes bacterium]|nr:tetratricopeptide repeat protein [Planctomycetota bacterium]
MIRVTWIAMAVWGTILTADASVQTRPATTRPAARVADIRRPPTTRPGGTAARTDQPESRPAGLSSEESLVPLEQLLRKRPLHKSAFASLVTHYAEQGRMQDLTREYEQKLAAMPSDVSLQILLVRIHLRAGQTAKAVALVDRIASLPENLRRDESEFLVLKSEVYQRGGRGDDAKKMLAEALSKSQTVSERIKLTEAIADLHLQSGNREQAAAAMTALSKQLADNYFYRKRIADSLSERSLHEAAAAEYREILALVRNQTDKRCEVLRQLGSSLERLDRRQEAIDAYIEAINLLSGGHWMQRELHDRVVSLYRASGRLDDLVKYCRDQVARSPEQTAVRALLADVLAAAGKPDEGKAALAEAIQLFPKDRALSEHRVQFLERLGDTAGMAAEYERMVAEYPEDVEMYIAYGQHLAQNRQLEAARNQWRRVLESKVSQAPLANRLGGLFEVYEMYDDAVRCYERAVTLGPNQPESYTALARLWFYRGEKDKAAEALNRLAQATPDDAAGQATLSESYLSLQMLDEGLKAITRACELAADDVRYRLARADLLMQSGKMDESRRVRREAIDLMRNPPQQAQALDVLVSLYASAGKLKELKDIEARRLERDPKDPVSLLLLAKAADAEHDLAEARKRLTTLLEAVPGHEEGRRQLARVLEAVGDIDSAVAEYRRIIEMNPSRGRVYYQAIADLKLRYNDKAGVMAIFDEMIKAAPGNASVLNSAAEQLVRIGEQDRAVGYYEQSLNLQANRHEVRLAYAKALQDAGRLEDALAAFKQVALQRTDRDSAAEALGRLHDVAGQLGSLDGLLAELEARVETKPDDTLVAGALAELLIRDYEYQRAMGLLDLMLRNEPRNADLQLVRAEVLRRLTRFDDALDAYRKVLRAPSIDRDFILGEMGKAFFESGQIDQAKTTWRQIGNKLYAGSLLQNNGLLVEAIEVYREGIRLKPDDFPLHRNLVLSMQAAGKTDEALEAARRLLDLEPDNIFNIQQLARAYLQRGNRKAAAEIAGRLFGANVAETKGSASAASSQGQHGMPLWMMSLQQMYGGGGAPARSNLDRAVEFFKENGLVAELEEVLTEQLRIQPENAILRVKAVGLFAEDFSKPETALQHLKELETAKFPIEYQEWLGQSSQRDHMRVRQYELISSKPALRDARLGELSRKPEESLSRDEIIELAFIRQSQGSNDKAIELLHRAVKSDASDVVALSVLVDSQVQAEHYREAEAPLERLIGMQAERRERMQAEMIDRVQRDFVRTLPLHLQLRITDDLLLDIAHKWTLGESFVTAMTGFARTMGWHRARLTQATIYAKTGRMEQARKIWEELSPANPADADGWTTLAAVAQLHDQQDLAFKYYQKALASAKVLAGDPLLGMIYSGSMTSIWFGESEAFDASFNKIVAAFADQDKLIDLYDFLRETDQPLKARRIAEQYKLYDRLKTLCRQRFDEARTAFRQSTEDPLARSVPLFMHACKLAELHDQTGDWPQALAVYEQYLKEFPDELALLITLSEVAEAQSEYEQALQWERKAVEAKQRLARQAREWALRQIYMTPGVPQPLASQDNRWEWRERWGKGGYWGYGSTGQALESSPSWLRIAQLYLNMDNPLAAGDAMERAIAAGGTQRNEVAQQVLTLIQQRQLTGKMLSVLRTLAVYLPTDEKAQLAFAESLEANGRKEVAAEVYRRMIRRGVSDVGTLARVRRQLDALQPQQAEARAETLEGLEAEVAADPNNVGNQLRLSRAYYYSLRIDDALKTAQALEKTAPHLEKLHDLLLEIYTLRGESEKLVEALRVAIERTTDADPRQPLQRRLVEELLALGKTDDALAALKKIGDAKDPSSYVQVGVLLHYFGRHAEALEQFKLASRSQGGSRWGSSEGAAALARATALQGDFAGAAQQVLRGIDEQMRQMSQYGGLAGAFGMFESQGNPFDPYLPLLVLYPELTDGIQKRLEKRRQDKPADVGAARLLMQFHRRLGRSAQAEAIVTELTDKKVSDQQMMMLLIDRAVRNKEYDKAIQMAEEWIAQQPKPTLPPGIPPQYAALVNLMGPRNMMQCKIGDIHWKKGDKDKAFESYRKILDEKVDETKLAYAAICMMRGRIADAAGLVADALKDQRVKQPRLLQFRALLAVLDNHPDKAFDDLAAAAEIGGGQTDSPFGFDEGENAFELVAGFAAATGQIDRFVQVMDKQIAKNKGKWDQYMTLAGTLRSAGRPAEADAVLDRAAKVKSLQREVLEQQVEWKDGFAPPDELITLYRKLIEEAERRVAPRQSLVGRFLGGGPSTEEEIDTQPLRDRLGDLLWNKGEREEARSVWTARMDMKTPGNRLKMAQRYLEKRDYDGARQAFEQVIELSPNDGAARQALARLAYERQDYAEMVRHLLDLFRDGQLSGGSDETAQVYYDSEGRRHGAHDEVRVWALAASRDPAIAARLKDGQTDEDADLRIMLSSLTGDWDVLDKELRRRIESTPYDPIIWTLWARSREHAGQWADAAKAWEQVRRLQQTTISRRREELKLVLAGRRVKDAAAGVKDAAAATASPSSPGGPAGAIYSTVVRYGGGSYGGSDPANGSSRLASLYVKLKEFPKAERLFLFAGRNEQAASVLPMLSGLLRAQGANDRALELLRMAVALGNDNYQLVGLAHLMAEAGQADAAIELLSRAYRFSSNERDSNPMERMMFGWYGGNRDPDAGFEQGEEQQYAGAIHEILVQRGKTDEVLARLAEQVRSHPDDARTGKLLLSLQGRSERWDDALRTLTSLQSANPTDKALQFEMVHVQIQRGDWDAALSLIEPLKKESPEAADRLRPVEAFLLLMKNEPARAVAAIEPLIDQPEDEEGRGSGGRAEMAVLVATRSHDKLASVLEAQLTRGALDDEARLLLTRLYRMEGRWAEAVRPALDEFWKGQPLEVSSPWYRDLSRTVRKARLAGAAVKLEKARPEDEAVLLLIIDGPAAAKEAFRKLAAEQLDNVNARRGLVLSAHLAGDYGLAIETNRALLAWLETRRLATWQPPTTQPVGEMGRIMLKRMQGQDVDASGALGLSMSFTQMLSQTFGSAGGESASDRAVNYDPLWRAHQHLARTLLAEAGQAKEYAALAEAQSHLAPPDNSRLQQYRCSRRRYSYNSYQYDRYYDRGEGFDADWPQAVRRMMYEHFLFLPLAQEFDQEGPRLSPGYWRQAAEVYASLGRDQDARQWRRRELEAKFAELQAAGPRLMSEYDAYRWRWGGYESRETERVRSLRWSLRVNLLRPDPEAEPKEEQWPRGLPPDDLWSWALTDPAVEARLLALGQALGPGWENSGVLGQLIAYHDYRREPVKIVELIERVVQGEDLTRSQQLGAYLRACYEAKDYARIEKVLNDVQARSPAIAHTVAMARLVLLRHQGRTADADAIEATLIKCCRHDKYAPLRPDPRLIADSESLGPTSPSWEPWQYPRDYWRYRRYWGGGGYVNLDRMDMLASLLGVPYTQAEGPDPIRLSDLRETYRNAGLYRDAVRILERELAAAAGEP